MGFFKKKKQTIETKNDNSRPPRQIQTIETKMIIRPGEYIKMDYE